jgi:hypothetical protein
MWIGLFLILAGVLVLLNNMDLLRGDVWDYIWPLFFIMLGASMVIKRIRDPERRSFLAGQDDNKDRIGGS